MQVKHDVIRCGDVTRVIRWDGAWRHTAGRRERKPGRSWALQAICLFWWRSSRSMSTLWHWRPTARSSTLSRTGRRTRRLYLYTQRQRWKWVIYRDPWPMVITPSHGTRRGRGMVVLDNPLCLESKNCTLKLSPSYDNMTNWVTEQFLNVN